MLTRGIYAWERPPIIEAAHGVSGREVDDAHGSMMYFAPVEGFL